MSAKVKILVLSPYEDLSTYEHRPMQEAEFFLKQGYEVETLILQRKVQGKGIIKKQIHKEQGFCSL